jgi:hypothetical protein
LPSTGLSLSPTGWEHALNPGPIEQEIQEIDFLGECYVHTPYDNEALVIFQPNSLMWDVRLLTHHISIGSWGKNSFAQSDPDQRPLYWDHISEIDEDNDGHLYHREKRLKVQPAPDAQTLDLLQNFRLGMIILLSYR